MSIPITVFTGFVGAGKTTTILALLSSLPKGYKACLLKNEFGDVQVDSQLARQSSLTAVSEILNGCLFAFAISSTMRRNSCIRLQMLRSYRSNEDCPP